MECLDWPSFMSPMFIRFFYSYRLFTPIPALLPSIIKTWIFTTRPNKHPLNSLHQWHFWSARWRIRMQSICRCLWIRSSPCSKAHEHSLHRKQPNWWCLEWFCCAAVALSVVSETGICVLWISENHTFDNTSFWIRFETHTKIHWPLCVCVYAEGVKRSWEMLISDHWSTDQRSQC